MGFVIGIAVCLTIATMVICYKGFGMLADSDIHTKTNDVCTKKHYEQKH